VGREVVKHSGQCGSERGMRGFIMIMLVNIMVLIHDVGKIANVGKIVNQMSIPCPF
jgi:hypothetical protein